MPSACMKIRDSKFKQYMHNIVTFCFTWC